MAVTFSQAQISTSLLEIMTCRLITIRKILLRSSNDQSRLHVRVLLFEVGGKKRDEAFSQSLGEREALSDVVNNGSR